jgi:hypothetical protein
VDNTPPRIHWLGAKVQGDKIHVTFRAEDGFSPISRAEYSLDAGAWQTVDPVGKISDSKVENYDFNVPIADKRVIDDIEEHTLVIRVYDRFENVGIGKAVLQVAHAVVYSNGR